MWFDFFFVIIMTKILFCHCYESFVIVDFKQDLLFPSSLERIGFCVYCIPASLISIAAFFGRFWQTN